LALAAFEDIAGSPFVKTLIAQPRQGPQAAPKRDASRQISQLLALFTRSFAGAGALVAVYRTIGYAKVAGTGAPHALGRFGDKFRGQ
jgi:hypothetical protein